MRPRSINIFLLEGDPDGIRQAQISMSTIQAVAFRKTKLREVANAFPEMTRSGVYILIGVEETAPDVPVAYIGEAESVATRLQYHAGRNGKPYWIDTLVLVSKDENLTKSHARYVEARLIADASANPRWRLLNAQQPDEMGRLPLPERASMEEFIDQTKTLAGALGLDLFKVVAGNLVPQPASGAVNAGTASQIFRFAGGGYDAQMAILPTGEFAVLTGSLARKAVTSTVPDSVVAARSEMLGSGILVDTPDGLRFTADYKFPSVSAAARLIYGGSMNGRTAWRLPDGRSYGDWEEQPSPAA